MAYLTLSTPLNCGHPYKAQASCSEAFSSFMLMYHLLQGLQRLKLKTRSYAQCVMRSPLFAFAPKMLYCYVL